MDVVDMFIYDWKGAYSDKVLKILIIYVSIGYQ